MQSSDMLHLCSRFFYASSACIYPENKQLDTEVEGGGLKEKDAWPAQVCHPSALPSRAFLSLCICIVWEHLMPCSLLLAREAYWTIEQWPLRCICRMRRARECSGGA